MGHPWGLSVNRLYFGDNLHVLREHIRDESVDLVYLDPPFNSKRDYNLLFKSPKGHQSDAQITAFEDSWHWGEQAEREYAELLQQSNTSVAELMPALLSFLGRNDMMAYLVMMANRLLELHRVLKPTGSLYLHCDPTASHYLKIVLDGVFGKECYRNEIIWQRSYAHSDGTQGAAHFGRITDTIFFYTKGDKSTWNVLFAPYEKEYVDRDYRRVDETGRRYRLDNIQGPGGAEKGNPSYEVMGVTRYWRYSKEKMDELIKAGRIVQTRPGAVPAYKRYLDEMPGVPVQNLWADLPVINNRSHEYLGYPTQKPIALLERIISASSDLGDVVLDPFCGCGTAVHAAQKLGRRWIGIDITHLAISLIEKRLKDAFPYLNHPPAPDGVPPYMQSYEVIGTPKDLAGARDLAERDKYQFQWWACSLVEAQPFHGKKKGADGGIDGLIFFQDDKGTAKKIVVSVKGGEHVSVPMIRELARVVEREKAEIGLFVTLAEPTKPMRTEALAAGFYTSPVRNTEFPRVQILTIKGLLDGTELARYPDLARGGHTFKKALVDAGAAEQDGLF